MSWNRILPRGINVKNTIRRRRMRSGRSGHTVDRGLRFKCISKRRFFSNQQEALVQINGNWSSRVDHPSMYQWILGAF